MSGPQAFANVEASIAGLEGVATPFLAVDLDALDRNLVNMQASINGLGGSVLRPHYKSHKSSFIARRQVQAGSAGITCSTAEEVASLAKAGISNLLLANVVADRNRLQLLAEVAQSTSVTAVVDSPETLDLLASAAERAGSEIGVLVELDIGMQRNGVLTVDAGRALGRLVARYGARLTLRGIQAYEGHLVDVADRAERERRVVESFTSALELRDALVQDGLVERPVIGGGSTSTYRASADGVGATDIQAGTYALMDAIYRGLAPEFEVAIAMVTSVTTSRPDGRVVVDAGAKRMGLDWGTPAIVGHDAEYLGTSEEHTMFKVAGSPPPVGGRLALALGHVCTSVAMHRHLYAVTHKGFDSVIEVDGRDAHA